jgi:hypothetical protein
MKKMLSGPSSGRRAVVLLSFAVFALAGFPGPVSAQSSQSASGAPVGTWAVQVTLRDCTTGAALGSAFNSLVTFHRGGTLSESAGGVTFAPGQRTAGHGTWTAVAPGTYLQKFVALLLFATAPNLPALPGFNPALPVSPGFLAGSSVVTHTFVLTDDDHATSSGTNEFYRTDGSVYRSGCSTAVAERFQ